MSPAQQDTRTKGSIEESFEATHGDGRPRRRIPLGWIFAVLTVLLLLTFVLLEARPSPALELAAKKAGADPRVQEALGTPLELGFSASQLMSCGGDVYVRDAVPIRGRRAAGTLYVQATRVGGRWHFTTLAVQPKGSPSRIDVLRRPPLRRPAGPPRPHATPAGSEARP
ncbi:MAG: hypothetical protein D6729_14975 [Deltaproteobacteria bacterium]|nr:MAG: hypothetical protein D6729_14975 [Deltaproteobacteria bacterium]